MSDEKQYNKVIINKGPRGWGGPLLIEPKPGKDLIYCVTGGGIHPVAQYIADLTGGTAFDGFNSKRDFEEIAVAVIDCGGTARVGVYPMKGVLTVDVHSTKPSGPLFRFIKEDLFVSGVSQEQIQLVDGNGPVPEAANSVSSAEKVEQVKEVVEEAKEMVEETVEEVKETVSEAKNEGKKRSGFMKWLLGDN
ncbi:MAG: hypothetical protein QNJ45_23700 [Ardenticatenaceae bacterium]|nr:hypothetical protein [Ardenticatenaceae bacterium]